MNRMPSRRALSGWTLSASPTKGRTVQGRVVEADARYATVEGEGRREQVARQVRGRRVEVGDMVTMSYWSTSTRGWWQLD